MRERTIPDFSNYELRNVFTALPELDRFMASPEHDLFVIIRENRTALSILTSNFRDFKKVLKFNDHGNIESKLWDSNTDFRFRLQKQIIRMMMNYLASVFFIIDYSRKQSETILSLNQSIHLSFRKKLSSEFSNDPLHRFIQDLRNYCTHRTFPKIASNSSFDPRSKQAFKTIIYLRKSELLQNFDWSAVARQYIDTCSDKILIGDVITTHYQNFMQFQNWIFLQILLVSKERTQRLIMATSTLCETFDKAKASHALLFKKSFVRYLKFSFEKAARLESMISN